MILWDLLKIEDNHLCNYYYIIKLLGEDSICCRIINE